MSPDASEEAPLDPTAARVADLLSAEVGEVPPATATEAGFVRRLARLRRGQRTRRRLAVGAAIGGTLLVLGLGGAKLRSGGTAGAALTYRVDGAAPPAGGYFLVSPTADSVLAFSDGSRVAMGARTRGRVVEVRPRGARFALDAGRVKVDIVPRPRAQWIFEAGPFQVSVHGTSFTVSWNPADAIFEVRLTSGAIAVASPLAASELRMRAGQSLTVSLRDQTSTIGTIGTTATPEDPATTGSAAVPGSPSEPPASSGPTAAPPAFEPAPAPAVAPPGPAGWSHQGWTHALSQSKAADIVAEADRRGVSAVLERADGDDLWALANAARYVGRFSLARQALTAQRRRFPSSARAREAAFLLGRLHDGDPEGPDRALGWYDRYLVETQDGPGASDALGRKMTLLQKWNRRGEALAVARDYLRRFPRGTYANAARALVRSSTTGP